MYDQRVRFVQIWVRLFSLCVSEIVLLKIITSKWYFNFYSQPFFHKISLNVRAQCKGLNKYIEVFLHELKTTFGLTFSHFSEMKLVVT